MTRRTPADMTRIASTGSLKSNVCLKIAVVAHTVRINGESALPVVRNGQVELITSFHRFQRKQYAPLEIVQTEKKGFGLRAGRDLRK